MDAESTPTSPARRRGAGSNDVARMKPQSTTVNSPPADIMRMVSPGFTVPSNTRTCATAPLYWS